MSEHKEWVKFMEIEAGEEILLKARKLAYKDGSYTVEVAISRDGLWTKPLEVHMSKLQKDVSRLMDLGVSLDARDLAKIVKALKSEYGRLPVKQAQVGLGFNQTGKDMYFQAGCVVSPDGKFYRNDERDGIPDAKGKADIAFLRRYATNVKRQLVLLHGLMAPLVALCIMNGDNMTTPLLLLVGESSTGKTTLARLSESLAISPVFRRTCLDFNSTDNSLMSAIGDVWGVPLVIDDTSLGDAKDYRKFIYTMSGGVDKGRLMKDRNRMVQTERRESGTTILMTSERDIMYGVSADYFGAAARLFTLQVKGSDLFDDSRMVMEAERSMEKNQGKFLPLIVKYVMEHGKDATIRKIHSEYQKIADALKGEDNIIQRWGRYFAVLKVTAGILKEVTELDFDADDVIAFMVGVLRERIQEQRSECTDALLEEELYVELLSHAEENRYIVNGECIRYITSKAYKGVIQKFICNNHLNYTYREISHKLCDMGLIRKASAEKADKNVYGLGKCYLLRVREEELAVEAAECRLDEKMAA